MANGEGWREGKIDTASHAAGGEAAAQLGHGPAAITFDPGAPTSGSDEATFGAAVIDQLARVGYATAPAAPDAQTVELVVTHNLIRPAEPPRSPIGGAVEVDTTGSRTLTGLALSIDLTKPRKALIATRLEARIRNNETHAVLWEGYASVIVALT
jgi:hypothetical protein